MRGEDVSKYKGYLLTKDLSTTPHGKLVELREQAQNDCAKFATRSGGIVKMMSQPVFSRDFGNLASNVFHFQLQAGWLFALVAIVSAFVLMSDGPLIMIFLPRASCDFAKTANEDVCSSQRLQMNV